MNRRSSLGLLFALMLSFLGAPDVWAQPGIDDPPPPAFNHLRFSVTTQLQQRLIGDPKVTHVLYLNGDLLRMEEGKLKDTAIDFEAIKKSLADEKRKEGTLLIQPVVRDYRFKDLEKAFQDRFEPFAKSLGFSNAKINLIQDCFSDWSDFVASVAGKPAGDSTTKEDAVKRKGVTIYPVKTVLSRYLMTKADCVVDFEAPFPDDWDGLLAPEMFEDIKSAIAETEFDARDYIQYRITSGRAAGQAVSEFRRNKATGQALGFRNQRFYWIEK